MPATAPILALSTGDWISLGEIAVLVLTLGALTLQLRSGARAGRYQAYQDLSREYSDFLWEASTRPELELNALWDPAAEPRALAELPPRTEDAPHDLAVWESLSAEDRIRYRYTRRALEMFERAWLLRVEGIIGPQTWAKWEGWIALWGARTWLFWPVVDETRSRLVEDFATWLDGCRVAEPCDPHRPRWRRRRTR